MSEANILGYKAYPNIFQRTEIKENLYSDYSGIILKIKNKR